MSTKLNPLHCKCQVTPGDTENCFRHPFGMIAVKTPDNERLAEAIGGTKHDHEKPRVELLPADALEEIAKVLTFGAKKYDAYNWCKGFQWGRLIGAALRHIYAFSRGEDKDPETGLSHIAHASCCLLFLIWHEKHLPALDDRYKPKSEGAV